MAYIRGFSLGYYLPGTSAAFMAVVNGSAPPVKNQRCDRLGWIINNM